MTLFGAFLKMIRFPNLIFIALTQVLFHFAIIRPILDPMGVDPVITRTVLYVLIAASVLIAAAGYIINDYFDINIDLVNKPRENVVDRIVSRRWAMLLHFILSGTGIILSFYVSWKTGLWDITLINFLCVLLLFGYSVSLKRRLLIGNIVIASLTAWVILILSFSEFRIAVPNAKTLIEASTKIIRLGALYAGFAFILTLIRESIKDMEDIQGDVKYGCRTMPIVWGINATKVYTGVWLIVLIAAITILQVYVLPFRWWLPISYSLVFILVPLILIFISLFKAGNPADFRRLSNYTKFVMFTGIVSMVFFYYYL